MHDSFEKNGAKVVMLIISQKEPHAGSLVYKDISQPETVAERAKLAKKMKDEFELPMKILVDSMKDTSRALFTDLPSPAFIIDERGILRGKMAWAQPEAIEAMLAKIKANSSKKSPATSNRKKVQLRHVPPKTKTIAGIHGISSDLEPKQAFRYQPPTNWVTVSINNPKLNTLSLQRVEYDDVKTVLELGKAKKIEVKVASGYYVLSENLPPNSKSETVGETAMSPIRLSVPADARFTSKLNISVPNYKVPKELRNQWSYIPTGPSVVGDVIGLGRDEERPVRIEYVKAFLIGRYEVSNQQYAEFLNDQAEISDDWLDLESRKCLIKEFRAIPVKSAAVKSSTKSRSLARYEATAPEKPVVMVSRLGALKYCEWLTQKTGVVHRLATEAEWEKAARGPESFNYAYGNICRIPAANQESGHLRKSGQFEPNGYGLYDMTGNCFEWVAGNYKTSTKLTGLLRGGSFIFDGIYNRNSFRMRQAPSVMTDDIGFRVVREIGQ